MQYCFIVQTKHVAIPIQTHLESISHSRGLVQSPLLLRNDPLPVLSLLTTDSKAIVDGNLKLILGMVWTLILHYSISMPVWEDEDDDAETKTPKQRLLGGIPNKVPDLPITNFSKDWRDGKALGALVDSCAPGQRERESERNPDEPHLNVGGSLDCRVLTVVSVDCRRRSVP